MEPCALEKVLIPGLWQGMYKTHRETACGARIVKMHLTTDGAMSMELRSQLGGAPNGQSWNNLSDKINNDSIKL